MSTQPPFLEKVLYGLGEGAIPVSGIIAATYLGSRYGLWSDEHAWIFTQGMLLLWGVWIVMVIVFVGLEHAFRPGSSPSAHKETRHTRHSPESSLSFKKEQLFSKAKNGRRDC